MNRTEDLDRGAPTRTGARALAHGLAPEAAIAWCYTIARDAIECARLDPIITAAVLRVVGACRARIAKIRRLRSEGAYG